MKKVLLTVIGVLVVCGGILAFLTPDHIKISDYIKK
jgi:hypothetical protein